MNSVPDPIPLIDPARRFVLFTNAKCGGTTLKSWFFANLDLAGFERRPLKFASVFGAGFALRHYRRGRAITPHGAALRDSEQIRRITNYYRHVYCAPALVAGTAAGYFKFAVVRNPEDRAVSAFLDKFCGEDRGEPWVRTVIDTAGDGSEISFAGFLDYLEAVEDARCNPHWRRQSYVLEGRRLDAFVRLEQLDADFRAVADRVGAAHLELLGGRLQTSARAEDGTVEDMTAAPSGEVVAWRAAHGMFPSKAAFLTDATRARLRRIYAQDYAMLPYDP